MPANVKYGALKNNFRKRVEFYERLEKLTVHKIKTESNYSMEVEKNDVKFVEDYETKTKLGENLIYTGTINGAGKMHGIGRYVNDCGIIFEAQFMNG